MHCPWKPALLPFLVVALPYRDGNREVYVMNADGFGQTRLTNDPALEQHPARQARRR